MVALTLRAVRIFTCTNKFAIVRSAPNESENSDTYKL